MASKVAYIKREMKRLAALSKRLKQQQEEVLREYNFLAKQLKKLQAK